MLGGIIGEGYNGKGQWSGNSEKECNSIDMNIVNSIKISITTLCLQHSFFLVLFFLY